MKDFVFYIVPAVLWMAVIFRLSAVPANDLPPMPSEFWLFWAHKATHFVEYTVLGFLLRRAVCAYAKGDNPPGLVWGIAAFILAFALSDEWHQSFTPGRMASVLDASTDVLYGWMGSMLHHMFQRKYNKI